MAKIWLINSVSPWLKRHGARRFDFVIDTLEDPYRYVLTRGLPPAGESRGWILNDITDDRLQLVERLILPSDPPLSSPPLRLVVGEPCSSPWPPRASRRLR